MTEISARRVRHTNSSTLWFITTPDPKKSYYATTYPQSDHIFLETAAAMRPVSALVARKLLPAIREVIAKAQEQA